MIQDQHKINQRIQIKDLLTKMRVMINTPKRYITKQMVDVNTSDYLRMQYYKPKFKLKFESDKYTNGLKLTVEMLLTNKNIQKVRFQHYG